MARVLGVEAVGDTTVRRETRGEGREISQFHFQSLAANRYRPGEVRENGMGALRKLRMNMYATQCRKHAADTNRDCPEGKWKLSTERLLTRLLPNRFLLFW